MKLTRLRLLGFKSFVEPTDFMIEPGLTGVVGPNGCGKSNLVEALRWVMGESSHKSMRASSMDDVIFSGSNSRPARNNAEVAIAIDNSTRSAPAAFNDQDSLEIARRIERDAGSNYRINGREVRARDVQILFADASTGARSPALVHQGRIGEIIQAKPEQRRRVLEEAAGVAGLHARRHEAELRLKAAETNLLRVEDVIGQLDCANRRTEKAGASGDPLSHRVVAGAQGRSDALSSALDCREQRGDRSRARQGCLRAHRCGTRRGGSRGVQAPGARRRQRCRNCARQRRAPVQPCIVSTSRCRILTAKKRAPRTASPNSISGLFNLPPTPNASSGLPLTPNRRLPASPPKKRRSGPKRAKAPAAAAASTPRWRRPMPSSALPRKFSPISPPRLPTSPRSATAMRMLRANKVNALRISSEIEAIERELTTLQSADSAPLTAAVEGAQAALTEAEAAAIAAEAAHNVARAELEDGARRHRLKPKNAFSASRPRRKPFPRCCRSRPAACGRR